MNENRVDYIIVGAGSAGCVLANRLTEDPHTRVLLVEAGGPGKRLEAKIPAGFYKMYKTEMDWDYETEPQPHLNNRRLYWPRGKAYGGSSAINAMIYMRGHRLDYDHWAVLGNAGWRFNDVLPYFMRMENQERGASAFHDVGGPLNVADLRQVNLLSHRFVEAAVSLGYEHNPDFNGAQQSGFGIFQVTQKNGQRQSAADAYLTPALSRPNLTAVPFAQVASIIFQGKTAVGITYLHDKKYKQAYASREVIISGGAINSPQLLLLSGVGPAEQLSRLGIPIVVDLPGVGQNLQDHPVVPFVFHSARPVTLDGADNLRNISNYLLFKRGPLTSNIAEASGFIRTRDGLDMPDIQYHFGPAYFIDHGQTKMSGHGISIGPTLLHPQSRGTITLQSSYPFMPPAIQPNYLAEQADMDSLVAGLKLAREMMNTAAFDPFRGDEYLPGEQVRSDADWVAYVRQKVETLYHPVGTCKMGQDSQAVVDERLRVHGVQGLRVVDASIMPTVVGGNTNAPVMMIAEKAADMIVGRAERAMDTAVLAYH